MTLTKMVQPLLFFFFPSFHTQFHIQSTWVQETFLWCVVIITLAMWLWMVARPVGVSWLIGYYGLISSRSLWLLLWHYCKQLVETSHSLYFLHVKFNVDYIIMDKMFKVIIEYYSVSPRCFLQWYNFLSMQAQCWYMLSHFLGKRDPSVNHVNPRLSHAETHAHCKGKRLEVMGAVT